MAEKIFKTRIKQRRDTSANWEAKNPVLLNGEVIIVDTANGETRTKTGNGIKTYTQLPFDDEGAKGGKGLIDKSFADNVSTSGNTTTIDKQLKTYSVTTRLGADVAITGLDENGQEVTKHKLSEKVDKVVGKGLVDATDIRTAVQSDNLTFTGKQKLKLRAEASDETWVTTIDANGVTIATPTNEVALTDSSIIVSDNSGESITINPQDIVKKDAQGTKMYALSEKVNKSEVLTKTNTTEFTPTADYHPATKKYVDSNKLSNIANGETTGTVKIGRTGGQAAEGPYSTIIGFGGHTGTNALGSVVIGNGECLADYTVAMGLMTVASGENQLVFGKYNVKDTENKYACIIGNGTSDTVRSNTHTVDWDGNAWFAGEVEGVKNGTTHKLSEKVDKVEGKSLIDENVASRIRVESSDNSLFFASTETGAGWKYTPGPERLEYLSPIGSPMTLTYAPAEGLKVVNEYGSADITVTRSDGTHKLSEKSEAKTYTVSVPTTSWTEKTDTDNQKYYYKKITVSGMTASGQAMTDVAMSDSVATARKEMEAYQCVNRVVTGDGYVELYCFEEVPTTAFTLRVLVISNVLS